MKAKELKKKHKTMRKTFWQWIYSKMKFNDRGMTLAITRYSFFNTLSVNVMELPDSGTFHNHVWDYSTLILYGGYTEEILDEHTKEITSFKRYPGWFCPKRKAQVYHRTTFLTKPKSISLHIKWGSQQVFRSYDEATGEFITYYECFKRDGATREQLKQCLRENAFQE